VRGGLGNDLLFGKDGDDLLFGGFATDSLFGGNGNDTLQGDFGTDRFTGGLGADVFRFASVLDLATGPNSDNITDFTQGEDVIDLSLIDTNPGGADDPFVWGGQGKLHGIAGEVVFRVQTNSTQVSLDFNGDGVADGQIRILAPIVLAASDFTL
jgi:serralysin